MKSYKITNPHPTGKKIGDCVVRALSIATNKNWLEVYEELCKIGASHYEMPNSKPVYEEYLQNAGFIKHKMPKHPTGKRYTVAELANQNNESVLIVAITRHLVAVTNGTIKDTWFCGNKSVFNYYSK